MRILPLFALLAFVIAFAPTARAESRFGTVMKKHFNLRSVSCYACHVKDEEKSVLNDFGTVVGKLIEDKQMSKRLEEAKDADSDARKEVYEQVEKEFLEAMKKLEKEKTPGGKTYLEAIQAGEIEGLKPRS